MNKEHVLLFSSFALSLVTLLVVVYLLGDRLNFFKPKVVVQTVVKEIIVTPSPEITATPSAVIKRAVTVKPTVKATE